MVKEIKKELKKVIHPEINNNLVDLGMIGKIKVINNLVEVELILPFINVPIKQMLVDLIKDKIKKFGEIKIKFKEMDEKQRTKFVNKAREGWKL